MSSVVGRATVGRHPGLQVARLLFRAKMPKIEDTASIHVMLPSKSLGHRTHRAPLHRRLTSWTCKVRAVLENSSGTEDSKTATKPGPTAAACMPAP